MESVQQSAIQEVFAPIPAIRRAAKARAQWQGVTLVLVSTICFSSAIIFTRLTTGLNPIHIAFFRAFFAFLFFCLLLAKYPQALHLHTYRGSILRLLGLGLAVGATSALFIFAIQNTTAANASLFVNSAPIYVALLAPLMLKERRARLVWLSIGLAIGGTVLLSNPAQISLDSRSFGGNLAGVLAGFTFALAMLFSRSLRDRVSGHTQILWSSGVASLVLLPWALQANGQVVVSNLEFLIPLGVISLGTAYLFNFLGLQRVQVQVVSVSALFEPVSSILIGLVLFEERPGQISLLGVLLILASIYLISRPEMGA